MGKNRGPPAVPNRHIYTRASYLFQAAAYLESQAHHSPSGLLQQTAPPKNAEEQQDAEAEKQNKAVRNLSRLAVSDMRAVSLKVLIRQSPAMKRTVCKFCDTLQVEGKTCHSVVENPSKGGRKPWADVLAIRCETCGHVKRYPVSAPRQKRRPFREQKSNRMEQLQEKRNQ